jgi:hypothetical protein
MCVRHVPTTHHHGMERKERKKERKLQVAARYSAAVVGFGC